MLSIWSLIENLKNNTRENILSNSPVKKTNSKLVSKYVNKENSEYKK